MLQIEVGRVTNDAEHEQALARINALWDRTDADALDEMNIVTMLVDAYERDRWPMGEPGDPVDILRAAIEHAGHTQAELARLLGSSSRASEVLSRKRALTIEMIEHISTGWGIPRDLLARPYEVDRMVVLNLKAKPGAKVARVRTFTTHVKAGSNPPKALTPPEEDEIDPRRPAMPKKARRKLAGHPQ